MGELHNGIAALIDQADLSSAEVAMVIDLISTRIKQLFALSIQGPRREPNHGG